MRSVPTPTEQSNANSLALLSAVEDGDAVRVKALLAEGGHADATFRGGETPLMRAAARGHEDIARTLLDAGADVNARRADGFTPLVLAVFFGHEEVVKLFIERGADVSAQTRLGTTAASWAASRGFARVAELLRNAKVVHPRPFKDVKVERVETGRGREVVKVEDAGAIRVADSEAVKTVETVKASDDITKFSRAASESFEASETANVSLRSDGRVPAHPSANAFRFGGFMRSWQGAVGTVLLLTALGVTILAIRGGNLAKRENPQPAQVAQSPTPQTPTPDTGITLVQPSPLPSPTPDAQAGFPVTGVPPETMYPAPGTSSQPFYVPPAAANAPSVPTVISENGAPPQDEDATRAKRKADAAMGATGESANRTPPTDNRESTRADDGARTGSTSRNMRPPVSEPQPVAPPARTSPPPSATPERGKVIQWPPQ